MQELPRRSSLVEQVVEILRHDLQSGKWSQRLPSERSLSDSLKVSRPTLRDALNVLRREKLIKVRRSQPTLITTPVRQRRGAGKYRLVRLLIGYGGDFMPPCEWLIFDGLRRHLHDAGFALEVIADARLRSRRPQRVLQELVLQTKTACWVLDRQTAEVQRWFAKQGLPTVVAGTLHEDLRLPSFDVNNRAICRHAAGCFLGLGHRRIALLIPNLGAAGDRAAEKGFLEGFHLAHHADAVPLIAHHDGTIQGLRAALSALLQAKSPPTGLLVSHSGHTLTVAGYLMSAGFRLPRDFSLISRSYDEFLDHLIPSVARYAVDWHQYTKRLARMALQMLESGSLPVQQTWFMAKFQGGETLGPPRHT